MAQGIHLSLSWSPGLREKGTKRNGKKSTTSRHAAEKLIAFVLAMAPCGRHTNSRCCGAMHHGWGRWVDVGQLKVYSVLCSPPSWGAIPYAASDQAAAPIQSAASRLRSRPIFRYDLPPPMGRASGCCWWMVIEGEIVDTCCRRWDSEIELEGLFLMPHG